MILVQRRPEPPALARSRERRLEAAAAAFRDHGAPSTALSHELHGYDATGVKAVLFEDQHKKCAWCEQRARFSSNPIEHYRPKDGAWRHLPGEAPRISPGHYWWLTWSWSNLLFACVTCNDRGHKANYFPLEPGSPELTPSSFDVSVERPLILDPAVDVFLDHVRWVPLNTKMARRLWTWSPRPLTERGRATIEILNLVDLAYDIEQHLLEVLDLVDEVEQHASGRRWRQAAATWERVLESLSPTRRFTAATWCALTRWMDAARLTEWGLPPPPRPR